MSLIRSTLAAAMLAMTAAAALANPGLLPNTGVDAAGVALAPGAIDPVYTVSGGGFTDAPAYATQAASGYPGFWMAPSAASSWITPALDGQDAGNVDAVIFTYTTRFDLTGFDATTARIEGKVAIDDLLYGVLLNGVDTNGFRASGYRSFSDFMIDSGFVAGVNTLSFLVNNLYGGPTGLRAELTLVAAPVPEPSAALLMAGGAACLLTLRRRQGALSR